MYKINENIPGWNGKQILEILAEYASGVPEGGNILELGALFGRSTYVLGNNKHPSVNLTVIDIWSTFWKRDYPAHYFHDNECSQENKSLIESKMQGSGVETRLEGEDVFSLWKHFAGDIPNLNPVRGLTIRPIDNFPMFDLIIHDAGHTYEDVYNDLNNWMPKLKSDGVIIVDDYEINHFPGVIKAVDQIVEEHGLKTKMVTGRNILLSR